MLVFSMPGKMAPRKGLMYCLARRTAGVKCLSCSWRGYRLAAFKIHIDARLDVPTATSIVKGVNTLPRCPKCNSTVVYTHVTGYSQ